MKSPKVTPRERHLLKTYGISLKTYEELLKKQNGCCAICLRDHKTFTKSLAVEHDHKSGYIRGLACTYCNRYMIGRHRDPEVLRRIADYISQDTGLKVPVKRRKKRQSRK